MKRILPDHAYGTAPNANCFWGPTKVDQSNLTAASGQIRTQIAIIGAGFTGLNAALALATAGRDVVVLDAMTPGWGASARNGGFCCLGGTKLPFSAIRRRHGAAGLSEWCQTEIAAVEHVRALLNTHSIDAQTHSQGETIVAHSAAAMRGLRAEQTEAEAAYDFKTKLTEAEDMVAEGMTDRYFGALTLPHGFGLNPRLYTDGLVQAVRAAGVRLHGKSPVLSVTQQGAGFVLQTAQASVQADQVIFATNGYSSEDIPDWLRGRYMPVQSNVLVTRPLSPDEIGDGWHSDQMAYTHQTLLHYFRLLPSGQFLFGMRGGLHSSPRADHALNRRIRQQFEQAFPMWADIETPHSWHGVLAFSTKLAPYVGPVPEMPGAFAAFAYHGNGVAMGSYSGALLADLLLNQRGERPYPALMQSIPHRFPLGRYRRALLAPGYAYATLTGR